MSRSVEDIIAEYRNVTARIGELLLELEPLKEQRARLVQEHQQAQQQPAPEEGPQEKGGE